MISKLNYIDVLHLHEKYFSDFSLEFMHKLVPCILSEDLKFHHKKANEMQGKKKVDKHGSCP